MGEPAGVGGELTLAAWLRRETEPIQPFFVIDDPVRLRKLAARLSLEVPIEPVSNPEQVDAIFDNALPVLVQKLAADPVPGHPDPANSEPVIRSIKIAVDLALKQQASGVVTNPIQKENLIETGFKHPGHTEYLAELTGSTPVMMLASPALRVVPVTTHVPLMQVSDLLTTERIVDSGKVLASALIADFGVMKPRVAVAALNPHGGENGIFGTEEAEIIAPAVELLSNLGIQATGPHPADSLFRASARDSYDAVLCMYHDQALIPLKALDFERGVNVTLGLPIVRTSPDHGTALDLAGTSSASAEGLISAIKMAAEIVQNRAELRASVR